MNHAQDYLRVFPNVMPSRQSASSYSELTSSWLSVADDFNFEVFLADPLVKFYLVEGNHRVGVRLFCAGGFRVIFVSRCVLDSDFKFLQALLIDQPERTIPIRLGIPTHEFSIVSDGMFDSVGHNVCSLLKRMCLYCSVKCA